MTSYDLSVIIPARNEEFLHLTVADVLKNSRAKTEVIVIADGTWPITPLDQDKRVTIVYNPTPIGQRASVNLGARVSQANYIMKLDAHCTVDEGFDTKLIENCEDDWTVIPRMYNLHAFDWRCKECGNKWYQGPEPTACKQDSYTESLPCSNTKEFEKIMVWMKRKNTRSDFFYFNKELKFNYWRSFGIRKEARAPICDVMCNLGACWFMKRDRFFAMDGLDENHGSWGQMGVEISCKSWLSGGKQKVNKNTWFAHLFRTQPGFGFPYPNPGTNKAKEYSRDYWLNNKWPKAVHKLDWLVEKFKPVPEWHTTKAVIYYTDSRLKEPLFSKCQEYLLKATKLQNIDIVSVSLKPLDFGSNITLDLEAGYLTMAKQILEGLKATTADVIYFAEHDVMYHPSHFNLEPKERGMIYYNTHVWKIRGDCHALFCDNTRQLSGLIAYRDVLITHFTKRVCKIEEFLHSNPSGDFNRYVRKMGFEPGTHGRDERVDDLKCKSLFSEFPNLDIRHKQNLTPNRWRKEQFRNKKYTQGWQESSLDRMPGWENTDIASLR